MVRALILAALICVFCRWAFGKWPWEFLRSAPGRNAALLRARKLLEIDAGAGREDIIAAHRRLTGFVHPDRGGTTAAMQEANAARDLLLADLPDAPLASSDDKPPPPPQD